MVSYKCAASLLFAISRSTTVRGASDPSSLRGSEGGARGLDDSSPVQVNNEKRRTAFSTKADLLGSSLETMHYPLPDQIGQESWCVYHRTQKNSFFVLISSNTWYLFSIDSNSIPEEACTDFGNGETSERIGDDSW